MAETTKVGIIGGGWPGAAHARGYQAAGGFKIVAVADLIPERRKKMMAEFGITKEYASADDLIADKDIAAVSVCVPTHLHQLIAGAALRAGKHVFCESPPALDAREARRMQTAAARDKRVLLYSMQRRFGGNELAARQAISRGYAGDVYHVRAAWTRTRGIPAGTGWYTDKSKAGGGVMIDLGLHMLDLAWAILGEPAPQTVTAVAHQRFASLAAPGTVYDVEDEIMALIRFEGGKTLELTAAWAINQPPQQNGALCRAYGDKGAIEVYTPQGAMLYRDFLPDGKAKSIALKQPKATHQTALLRHFRQCILGEAMPEVGADQGLILMQMVDAMYKSAEWGRSVEVRGVKKGEATVEVEAAAEF